jgi:hypothetical protein
MMRVGTMKHARVVALLSAAASAGCASLWGFDDLTTSDAGPADVVGATDQSTSSSGSSGGGDSALGSGGGYLTIASAGRVCSLVFRCPSLASSVIESVAVPVDQDNYSLCVHWLAGAIPSDRVGFVLQSQVFQCVAQTTTCTAAGACLALENLSPGDPRCTGGDGGEHCGDNGATVYRCAQNYLLHCGSPYYASGSTCLTGADGTHWCALGTNCSVKDSCIGTLNDYCGAPSNLHFNVNCSYDGYTCGLAVNSDSGITSCYTGNMNLPCSSPGTSCSGTTLQVCDGTNLSDFDCAALGDTCSTQAGAAICVHSGDTCTPFDIGVNQCTGSSISLCVGGHPLTFDCASIGMSCVPASGPTSGHCG